METAVSGEARRGFRCSVIRLLLLALACAEWVALWSFVYRSTLGI
jgi:hypothetical protein